MSQADVRKQPWLAAKSLDDPTSVRWLHCCTPILFIDITFSSPRLNNYSTLPLQGSLHHCSLRLLAYTWSRRRKHRSWSHAFDGARGYDTQKGGGECGPGQFSPETNNGFSRGLAHTVNCKLWIRSCTWQKKKRDFFPGDTTDYLQVFKGWSDRLFLPPRLLPEKRFVMFCSCAVLCNREHPCPWWECLSYLLTARRFCLLNASSKEACLFPRAPLLTIVVRRSHSQSVSLWEGGPLFVWSSGVCWTCRGTRSHHTRWDWTDTSLRYCGRIQLGYLNCLRPSAPFHGL